MPFAVQTVEAIANGWRHAPKPMTDINVTTTYGLVKDVLNNLRGTSCSFSPNGYLFVGVGLQQYHAAYPNEVTTCIIPPNPGALPPGTVLLKAVSKGHFRTWPGLTEQLIKKHLPPSVHTALGHMKKIRQGRQSTKRHTFAGWTFSPSEEEEEMFNPTEMEADPGAMYTKVLESTDVTAKIYGDTSAIDMRFYWIKDRVKMGHFHVFWRPGTENIADYWTKLLIAMASNVVSPLVSSVATCWA